jgi:hypothetical protein
MQVMEQQEELARQLGLEQAAHRQQQLEMARQKAVDEWDVPKSKVGVVKKGIQLSPGAHCTHCGQNYCECPQRQKNGDWDDGNWILKRLFGGK